jgi:hypothetical protein
VIKALRESGSMIEPSRSFRGSRPVEGNDAPARYAEVKKLAEQGKKASLRGEFDRVHLHQIEELHSDILFQLK